MSKILAFGASNSINSINKRLASYTAKMISPEESVIIDLNDSNIIHDTITIKNLNIESINNKLPPLFLLLHSNVKVL